jgi:uracil phosphoribosyltransferase
MPDMQFESLRFQLSESAHRYGDRVHILANPFLLSHLVTLSNRSTTQPAVNRLVTILYQELIQAVVNVEFPRRATRVETRMFPGTPEGVYEGEVIDPRSTAVTVNIARAGTLPSQVCFDALNEILDPEGVRQDHFAVARTTDADDRVTGAAIGASKIGGAVDGRFVLFPDPMGATGSSMAAAVRTYKEEVEGTPERLIAIHLIITPEYLKRMTTEHPELTVYALRLDRGLSDEAVLRTVPGTFWERERGLNERGYIVPGAGGLGEVMNNSWV